MRAAAPGKYCDPYGKVKQLKIKYSSTISSQGQVTVPQEIRNRRGLAAGDRVDFVIEGERTVIRPSRSTSSPFRQVPGSLRHLPRRKKGNQRMVGRFARRRRAR